MKWLHISDLHFGKTENPDFNHMWEKLSDIAEEHAPLNYLFITGDLRYAKESGSGYPSQVKETITKVQKAFRVGPDRTFIVPGNHDVTRGNSENAETLKAIVTDARNQYRTKGNYKISSLALDNLKKTKEDFYKLRADLSRYGGDNWNFCENLPECAVIGLDTSITSLQSNERGSLILDFPSVEEVFKRAEKEKPKIVLAHHDLEELENQTKIQLLNLLDEYQVILYLCGHSHHTDVKTDKNRNMTIFVTGTFQHQDKHLERPDTDVLVGELNSDGKTGYVKAYRWESRVNKWFPDPVFSYQETQGKAQDGIYYFPQRDKTMTPLYQSLGERYLYYLRERCGKSDLHGAHPQNRNIKLEKVFVPPHFQKRDFFFEKIRLLKKPSGLGVSEPLLPEHPSEEITLDEFLSGSAPLRAVVLSDPGGGKSTLLKYIAAKEEFQRRWFPVWLRGSDFQEPDTDFQERDTDLEIPVLKAATQCAGRQAGLNRNFWGSEDGNGINFWNLVREHIEKGDALLLIDGLDEISSDSLREELAKELKRLIKGNGKANLILTLRDSGFSALESWLTDEKEKQTPCPNVESRFTKKDETGKQTLRSDLGSVSLYRLAPMAQDDVEKLCGRWLAADGGEEADGRRLADVIIRQKHTNTLSANPLMLTLMLLVRENHEGWLPDTPVTLYAAASSLLLERWVADWEPSQHLDLEEIRYQLSFIAFSLRGTIEISKSRLTGLLDEMRQSRDDLIYRNRNISGAEFLRMLDDRNALLLWNGIPDETEERAYVFQHRVFWEYFSALAVDRNCYQEADKNCYQETDRNRHQEHKTVSRPLDAFRERLLEPGTAEIVLLTASMESVRGRMLAEDLTKLLQDTPPESEEYVPVKNLLLRFLIEEVRLDQKTVREIFKATFRDGITSNDPIAVYYILRGRYAENLREYFKWHGETYHSHHGGGAYWATLLDMLDGREELRDVWRYYQANIDSVSVEDRLNALTALASAIWMNKTFFDEQAAFGENAAQIYPHMPEIDPGKSIRDMWKSGGAKALTRQLLKIAESEEPKLRWHALRALHQGFFQNPGDFLRGEDFPRYLRACIDYMNIKHINQEYEMPWVHWDLIVTVLPALCRKYGERSQEKSLRAEALGLICTKFEGEPHDGKDYDKLLSLFILALLGHEDSKGLERVFQLILREQKALLERKTLGEVFFDATFQFAECLEEVFLGNRNGAWEYAVSKYGTNSDEQEDTSEPLTPYNQALNPYLESCFYRVLRPVFQYMKDTGNKLHLGCIHYCPALQDRLQQGGADERFDIDKALYLMRNYFE